MDRLLAMEAFVKTVDTGSMSRAAEQLGVANASVTALVRGLERHLGVTLLQRSTRYVRLTDEGARYYESCRNILARIGEAEATVADPEAGPRGVLRIESPIAVGQLLLGPALVDFSRECPNLRIVTSLNNEVDNLIKRGIDVAIRMDAVDSGELVARHVYRARYALCAAPGFLAKHGPPGRPGDINPRHCLGFAAYPSGAMRPWRFRIGQEQHVVTPEGQLFFNSSDALIQAAIHDGGMIYVLEVLAEHFCRRGELVRLLPEWDTDEQSFFAVYLKTSFTPPKVRAFVDFLTTRFAAGAQREPVPVRAR